MDLTIHIQKNNKFSIFNNISSGERKDNIVPKLIKD